MSCHVKSVWLATICVEVGSVKDGVDSDVDVS